MSYLKRAEKQGRKFLNPVPTDVGGLRIVFKVLPQYLSNKAQVEPKQPLGPFRTDARVYAAEAASGLRVTWFGHSASLIEIDGMRVLVDPVWEPRASPFSFMGPKRFFEPTIALEALPTIDVVLISHDHYDHLGADTVGQLAKSPNAAGARWVTSLGVAKRLRGFGVAAEKITELDWTESVEVGALKVTSWPSRHFSGRGVLDRFTTLWGSFVIEGFCGDWREVRRLRFSDAGDRGISSAVGVHSLGAGQCGEGVRGDGVQGLDDANSLGAV
jgi:hypothetical protein